MKSRNENSYRNKMYQIVIQQKTSVVIHFIISLQIKIHLSYSRINNVDML